MSICYGVATISRPLKITRLFCKRALSKRQYSAKETYNRKEPTNRSHTIFPLPKSAPVFKERERADALSADGVAFERYIIYRPPSHERVREWTA